MKITSIDNRNCKDLPTPQPGQGSKGIGVPTARPFEGDVSAMNDMFQNDLLFLEWTEILCTGRPDILKYMLESSNASHRVIARRIIKNAEGRD